MSIDTSLGSKPNFDGSQTVDWPDWTELDLIGQISTSDKGLKRTNRKIYNNTITGRQPGMNMYTTAQTIGSGLTRTIHGIDTSLVRTDSESGLVTYAPPMPMQLTMVTNPTDETAEILAARLILLFSSLIPSFSTGDPSLARLWRVLAAETDLLG